MYERIKGFLADDGVFFGLLILMVAAASFGLGKLSMGQNQPKQPAAVTISLPSEPEALLAADETKNYVASKNGTKYHLRSCPGVKQMNEANKIFFSSAEEAQSSGYTAASNCPGL